MSYIIWRGNPVQSRRSLSRSRQRRMVWQVMRITQISVLLLHSGSNYWDHACVSASSSQIRRTNNVAGAREGYYEASVVTERSKAMEHDGDMPLITSPNFLSNHIQHSEAVIYGSIARRTQANAACSANPVCAASGLAGDCCPTSSGMFLSCCSQTEPPVSNPTSTPVTLPTNPPILPTTTPISTTDLPTAAPIRAPTTLPSVSPVRLLTLQPTQIVTTNIPTAIPTFAPMSKSPITAVPVTSSPIVTATLAPTLAPDETMPTSSPQTVIPTTNPSVSTPITTAAPSAMTTIVVSESAVPSHTPSAFLQYRMTTLSILGVQLTLLSESSATRRNLQTSDNETNCTKILQNLLTERMENEVDSIINVIESLFVEIQNFTVSFANSTVRLYNYDVLMDIRSPMEEHDVNRYVEGSLLSQVQKNLFLEELRDTDCPEFQYLSGLAIAVPRMVEEKSTDRSTSKLSMGLVAGIIAGCATLMILVGAIFIGSRIWKRDRLPDDDSSPVSSAPKRPMREGDAYNMSIFDRIEVSTLGDPVTSEREHPKKSDVEDSTIGSANIEYDYRKAFGDVHSITDSQLAESSEGSSPNRRSLRFGSLDDPSLQNSGGVAGGSSSDIVTAAGDTTLGSPFYISEEQFDVVAPAGLLGLILETSIDDGRPMVYSIKPSSSLAHILKVGDRLIAVDGIDVSRIRASDVSRMIAEKKDKERQLVFCRLVKGNVLPNKRY